MDLRDALSDLTHLLNRLVGEKVTLSLSHDPMLSAIRADKRQLEQVLMNLVVNARDAMPEGGSLTVQCRNLTIPSAEVAAEVEVPPGEYVCLSVADTGTGMTQAVVENAFDPFFTTKEVGEGTGLGLSMVYGFAQQSGGHIHIASALGSGTTVYIYLPRADYGEELEHGQSGAGETSTAA